MMAFFCPACWAEVSEQATTCPRCNANITEHISQADYVEKLIAALSHKEPTTPVRAAWILGERLEKKAVPALTRIVHKAADAFLVESAVEALGKIGGKAAVAAVRTALRHSSLRVRVKAREALMKITDEPARTAMARRRRQDARA
jgi:HEAT repeat protein